MRFVHAVFSHPPALSPPHLRPVGGQADLCASARAQGRALGFDGKTLIHPKTLAAANRVFAPSATELEHSRRVVAAFEAAAAGGSALVVLDGWLVEELHVHAARRLLALGEAVEASEAEA